MTTATLTTKAPIFPLASEVGALELPMYALQQESKWSKSLTLGHSDAKTQVRRPIARHMAGRQWLSGGDIIRPIRVEIHGAGRDLTVSEEQTGIYGAGSDLASAINDFRAALKEHLDVLESSGPLSEELKHQLSILRRHLRAS
jgi:hypothetical protein